MDVLDQAYDMLQDFGPEYGPMGFSNHAPMAVEAIVALGRPDAALPWARQYAQALGPQPHGQTPIDEHTWRAALGAERRFADWAAFFTAELAHTPPGAVLDRWAARLAPGLVGAALHGLLRAGHAARALTRADTAARRRELAQGLAYWAATYQVLPGSPSTAPANRAFREALHDVPFLPDAQRRLDGSIVAALYGLDDFAPFRPVIGWIDPSHGDPAARLSELTAALAAAYCANIASANLIALIHFVTGPSAVRLLLPHVTEPTARLLLTYAWQAGAALFAVYGTRRGDLPLPADLPPRDVLIDGALASGDEHAIKFVEACLREDAVAPNPIYRAAAADAVGRF